MSRFSAYALLIVFLLALSPVSAQADCGLDSRLSVGQQGRVTPGAANNVRAEPSRNAELTGQIPGGASFMVIGGPQCADGFTWLQIEYASGKSGWTVEATGSDYFLEPVSGDAVSFQNISFILPPEIASSAEGAAIEAEEPTEEEPWNHSPAYVEFTFTDYPDTDYRLEYDYPALHIYTSDAFDGIDNMLGGAGQYAIEGVGEILEQRPDLHSFGVITDRLPDDRPGAANIVLARLGYLDFQNGSGYRYITAYAQDFVEPNNTMLVYRYQGLTADGKYFVSAWFPIDSPQLPEPFDREATFDDTDDGFGAFQAYSSSITALFDSLPAEDYTPDLTQLDALIASATVGQMGE